MRRLGPPTTVTMKSASCQICWLPTGGCSRWAWSWICLLYTSAIGLLVYGLALRRERGLPALTLLSCDNLQANGDTLRSLVPVSYTHLDVYKRQT